MHRQSMNHNGDQNNSSNNNGHTMSSPSATHAPVHSFISTARGYPADGGDFEFFSPPDAPIFRPTEQEFAMGPLAYVAKIRPIAEPFGICRIVPPPSFKPPFAVDMNRFCFTPRVQRLNEVEAVTRIKMNFLERLIRFWDLQGATLKTPQLDKKALDLHSLHTVVQEEGGFESCTREKKWSRVATKLGYSTSRHNKGPIASLLRQHYERILFPYDVFLSGATIPPDDTIASTTTTTATSISNDTLTTASSVSSPPSSTTTTTTPTAPLPCTKTSLSNTTAVPVVDVKIEKSSDSCESSENQPPVTITSPAAADDETSGQKDDGSTQQPMEVAEDKKPSSTLKSNVRKLVEENENNQPERKQLRSSPRRQCRRMGGAPPFGTVAPPVRRSPITRLGNPLNRANGLLTNLRSSHAAKELKKLQVFGAGPKMPGVAAATAVTSDARKSSTSATTSTLTSSLQTRSSSYVSIISAAPGATTNDSNENTCMQCGGDDPAQPHLFIHCVDCNSRYHLHCLIPPLNDRPKGSWHCARCIAYLVQNQPQAFNQEFGFIQSTRKYSLAEFTEMADNFKQDYFRMKPTSVPYGVVEKEFWRIMSSMEDCVTVEYGADLHTNDYVSGFPTKGKTRDELHYVNHPWNLNNLPILTGSVFKHIDQNISGMIVPWMYVGMCFSTFCWHNEDHWSYSINYLHQGEAKSWYGVPGEHADTFERAMKRVAADLFESQPDLLHQLVTQTNPNILMGEGVPIYKCHQNCGDFVITFPRSYHAGFNQGINFAEAVNFAPADWLPIGRACVTHYSMLHRYPVFSHDELVCKMANSCDDLTPEICVATYHDMIRMVTVEQELRLEALSFGISKAKVNKFEILPDDERLCVHCKTTLFLSGITCSCSPNKMVCIPHKDKLCSTCSPSQHILKYRYSLDELPAMLQRLKIKADQHQEQLDLLERVKQAEDAADAETEEEED